MKKHAFWIWATITVIGVVGLWAFSWAYTANFVTSSTPNTLSDQAARGVFGDQFGGINALFTGLAFTGVIISLILQQREIRKQAETLQRQQFEGGFFHLMALHTTLIDQLEWGGFSGRQVFEKLLTTMRLHSPQLNIFHLVRRLTRAEIGMVSVQGLTPAIRVKLKEDEPHLNAEIDHSGSGSVAPYLDQDHNQHRKYLTDAYIAAHDVSNDALSHYFRTLYHILKYIDRSDLIDDVEKLRYAKLVAAQLSGLELTALFYNSLVKSTQLGGKKFQFGYPAMFRLIKRYDLMENLNANMLFHPIHMEIFSELTAEDEK
jgi:hypothetical protein